VATPTPVAALLLTPHEPNPNPVGGDMVWLPYSITADAMITMRIFDVAGEQVRAWNSDPQFEAAATPDHERPWDLKNSSGMRVGSGVFLVQISAVAVHGGTSATVWEKCAVVH
jgi:hypothetical protein